MNTQRLEVEAPRLRLVTAVVACVVAVLGFLPAAGHAAVTPEQIDEAVRTGGQWLAGKQSASGTIPGFNGDWATTAVAAAGINAADVKGPLAERSLQDFWLEELSAPEWGELPPEYTGVGQIGKAALIAYSAGLNPARIAPDVNLAATLASTYDPATGLFGTNASPNAIGFALFALPDLGLPSSLAGPIVNRLLGSQHDDGGWTFSAAGGSSAGDTDMTGAVLAMVCSNGLASGNSAVDRGLAFLKGKQDEASGAIFSDSPWLPDPNSPTIAWALTGLLACGEDPQGPEWTTGSGKNVLDGAFQMRIPETGEFRYKLDDPAGAANNVNATEAMVRALSGNLFSADPPARTDPALPRIRPVAAVAPGTEVPVALSIEAGGEASRLCAVKLAAGSSLVALLAKAQADSIPAGCVDGFTYDGDRLVTLNGATAVNPDGGWAVSIEGAPERRAGGQTIRHGAVVSLRLSEDPLPSEDVEPGPGTDPGKGPSTDPGPAGGGSAGPVRRPAVRPVKGGRRVTGRRALIARVVCPRGGACRVGVPRRVKAHRARWQAADSPFDRNGDRAVPGRGRKDRDREDPILEGCRSRPPGKASHGLPAPAGEKRRRTQPEPDRDPAQRPEEDELVARSASNRETGSAG